MPDLENVSVVEGKLIQEMPSSRLDVIITRGTERMARLTTKIAELVQERTDCQVRVDRATTLKAELEG